MSQYLTRLKQLRSISFLIVGLLLGCNSSESPTPVIVVGAHGAGDGISSTGLNTDDESTAGVVAGDQTGGTGDDTAGVTVTTESTGTGVTGSENSTDTGTDAGTTDTDAGTDTTDGTTGIGGETTGTETTGGTTTSAATTGSATTGESDSGDAGVQTDGSTDEAETTAPGSGAATDGTTAGTTDAAGTTTAGTTTGATTGATTGPTAGTTAGATTGATEGATTGSTTSGSTGYAEGSLAALLESETNLSTAFEVLQNAGVDQLLNDPDIEWTVFLPTNEALLADPSFDYEKHVHTGGALSATALTGLSGQTLLMFDTRELYVGGGGANPLTIAGSTVIEADLMGNASPSVVHVIDTVIGDNVGSPYPPGTLLDTLFKRGDLLNALSALKTVGLDLSLNDPASIWTVFLPNDDALNTPDDFDAQVHIYTTTALTLEMLTGLSGSDLTMNSSDLFSLAGGEPGVPLSIGGFDIIEADFQDEAGGGPIVHIIDGVLAP